MSARVGVLHTVPGLVPVFHALLTAHGDDLDIVHVADPSLLARAVEAGSVTADVTDDLRRHLAALREAGASSVLVTCSSIGEAAAAAASTVGLPLVRVDAAMAAEAVARASAGRGRILVLATVQATLGPTKRLVEAAAGRGRIDITAAVVAGAADARSAGDQERHDRLIADAVAAGDADAIVLAQASMATGAGDDPRVLTSPESGAAAFAASLAGRSA
ncbi:aspartate/glutamate racemase family protein [Microbacterium lushaniae]|uniref:Arylsulfatase n=1 Tax=Microbacterium lushaniae TaxID=2614639 RepID=A0A5J6L091_9MICO|nr:aspartate/glutamate racemase family protein [Microbacterium lushaniae]QEW01889.1 arylsulfatase [Microbacterium lushaniae]